MGEGCDARSNGVSGNGYSSWDASHCRSPKFGSGHDWGDRPCLLGKLSSTRHNREGVATRVARPILLRESTGSTESCLTEPKQTVVALVPKDHNRFSSTPTPTLYSFIPANKSATLTLTLRNPQGTEVYRQERPALTEAGIIGWLVENVSLKSGVDYQWQLTLTCTNSTTAVKTISWFRLMPLSPSQQQRIVQAKDVADAFAMAGYWYDTLD